MTPVTLPVYMESPLGPKSKDVHPNPEESQLLAAVDTVHPVELDAPAPPPFVEHRASFATRM